MYIFMYMYIFIYIYTCTEAPPLPPAPLAKSSRNWSCNGGLLAAPHTEPTAGAQRERLLKQEALASTFPPMCSAGQHPQYCATPLQRPQMLQQELSGAATRSNGVFETPNQLPADARASAAGRNPQKLARYSMCCIICISVCAIHLYALLLDAIHLYAI